MQPTRTVIPIALLLIISPSLMAHPGHAGGFTTGLLHPLTGLDHLLAMVAVGMLGARCGGSAQWLVPASFMGAMLIGGLLALSGVALPGVEIGIALSVLAFGVLVALATPPKPVIACLMVAVFAVLHGHAHITEMGSTGLVGYTGGFLLATAALHASGLVLAGLLLRTTPNVVLRSAGGGIAACGLALAVLTV